MTTLCRVDTARGLGMGSSLAGALREPATAGAARVIAGASSAAQASNNGARTEYFMTEPARNGKSSAATRQLNRF